MYKDISEEDIKREYFSKPGVNGRQAAKALGVTYKTFNNKMSFLGLSKKKRSSKYEKLNDKEWVKNEYFVKKSSVRRIAKEIGATHGAVYSAIKWAGLELRSSEDGLKLRFPNGRYGSNSSNWRGGIRSGGRQGRYTMILLPSHPQADSSGYVMEHRLVIEKELGRYLTKDEIVHHLDGDGHNNSLSNLQLTTRKKHFGDHFDAVKEVDRLKKLLSDNNISF